MTVVILTAVPPGLRGHLTRWLLEISPGVFIGQISTRVRELMWLRIVEFVAEGRAFMVHSAHGEQRLVFKIHGHDWTPIDYDGVTLIRRPTTPDYIPSAYAPTAKPLQPAKTPPSAERSPGMSPDTVWKRRNARRKFKRK